MISPWTIYKEKKESSLSPIKSKKNKDDPIKSNKKPHKNIDKQSSSQTQAQFPQKSPEQNAGNIENLHQLQFSYKIQSQGETQINPNNINAKQNNKQPIHNQNTSENEYEIDEAEQIFKGLNHPQLITDEARSKKFLKNVVSDPFEGYLDNSKLLQFCKNQSNNDPMKHQPRSPHKRRSITNLMLIESQKQSLIQEINSLIMLKYIKQTLRIDEAIERQVDNNIEQVLQKLSHQFKPRINPQELLLEKLLKNENEKMMRNKQHSKSVKKQQHSKEKHSINENNSQKTNQQKSPKKQRNQIGYSTDQIMQTLELDIEKSSIIKYLNSNESAYLEEQKLAKKSKKDLHNHNSKSKEQLKQIQLNINNEKLNNKLIYVGKKPFTKRLNHQQSNSSIKVQNGKSYEGQNPQSQPNQKSNKNQGKQTIENLIKQHMVQRQSRKHSNSSQKSQSQKIETIQVDIRKLKGKNYIVSQTSLQIPQQSNLISPRLKKSRTINLINEYPTQKNDHKKNSNLSLKSPLMPPQFQLPQLSHRTLESNEKNLSPSSKLLDLITNNILQHSYKSSKRNSAQNQKGSSNLIDKLFVKDKEKKQMMMRRNFSVNVKNTNQILRKANMKKLLNLDEQIMELKQTQISLIALHKQDQVNQAQPNEPISSRSSTIINALKKDFLTKEGIGQDYNFTRKRPHKLTSLETELIDLISPQTHLNHGQNTPESTKRQKNKSQMKTSATKFSDHQIVHDMNLMSSGKVNSH